MSGEENSNGVQQRWEKFLEIINHYISSIGLDKIQYNIEVEEYLSLTKAQIFKMDKESCSTGAYILSQYSAFLQKESNKHNTKLTWAEHNLNIVFGQIASSYGTQYTSYEERKSMCVKDNVYASALNNMILTAKTAIKELEFLSGKVSSMAKIMLDISQTKSKNYD